MSPISVLDDSALHTSPMKGARKVQFIGLDCAPPQLVLDKYREDLRHLSSLMHHGVRGEHGTELTGVGPI